LPTLAAKTTPKAAPGEGAARDHQSKPQRGESGTRISRMGHRDARFPLEKSGKVSPESQAFQESS
jgi:hypothetical protein